MAPSLPPAPVNQQKKSVSFANVEIHPEPARRSRLNEEGEEGERTSVGGGRAESARFDDEEDEETQEGVFAEGVMFDEKLGGLPASQGLYSNEEEKDSCGVRRFFLLS